MVVDGAPYADTPAAAACLQKRIKGKGGREIEFQANQAAIDVAHLGLVDDEWDCLTTCNARQVLALADRIADHKHTAEDWAQLGSPSL